MIRTHVSAVAGIMLLAIASAAQAAEGAAEAQPRLKYPDGTPLVIMSIDGKELRVFTSVPGYDSYGSPLWSRDGKRVAFDAHVGDLSTTHSFVVNADGSSPKDLGDGAMPSWAPGDQRLVIHRYSGNWGIWVIQPDGTGLERLTSQGNSPRWCPDGVQIAHLGIVEGPPSEHGIMMFNTVEGTDMMLISGRQPGQQTMSIRLGFQWAPDGKRLAFVAQREGNLAGVYVFTTEGPQQGLKMRLSTVRDRLNGFVAWSPDSKELLISLKAGNARGHQLHRLGVDGDEPPARLPGQDPTRSVDDLAWSPDGKWVLFNSEAVQ